MRKEILFSYFPKATYQRYRELVGAFSTLEEAWKAELSDLIRIGWSENLSNEFLLWRESILEEKIAEELDRDSIQTLVLGDSDYPRLLAEVYDPPVCLFLKGETRFFEPSIAVVGARKNSVYGRQVTSEIVANLAGAKITIVSGLAVGIDGIAHEAALGVGGRTVAVLGGGIDRQHIYPAVHKMLADRIIANGGSVVSEYPPKTLPTKYSFPRRNRIVAGLSLGTLVIEAGEESGSLITARYALDNGREVFAVPQNITSPTSLGPNKLIKNGAHPVLSATDIFEVFSITDTAPKKMSDFKAATPAEETIMKLITREPYPIDKIIKESGLESSLVMSTLAILEMRGVIRNVGAMSFVRT